MTTVYHEDNSSVSSNTAKKIKETHWAIMASFDGALLESIRYVLSSQFSSRLIVSLGTKSMSNNCEILAGKET